jgi:acetyl esterase
MDTCRDTCFFRQTLRNCLPAFLGDYQQDDPWCRYLAAHADITVTNVDSAVAPTHRFPVPVEQADDVLNWAASTERNWNGR